MAFRGRRITEPTPIIRAMPLPSDQNSQKLSDLENVWDNIGKTKTAMRRTEHRIEDSLRPLVPLDKDRSPLRDNMVLVDRLPRYKVGDDLHDGPGDKKHSSGQYNRKISRRVGSRTPRSPLRESNIQEYRNRSPRRVGFKDYPEYKEYGDPVALHESRADVLDHDNFVREPRYKDEGSYGRGDRLMLDRTEHRDLCNAIQEPSRGNYSSTYSLNPVQASQGYSSHTVDLTDSRALRQTDIRFLNDDMVTSTPDMGAKGVAPRLHHVDVKVPPVVSRVSAISGLPGNPYNKEGDHNATYVSSGNSTGSYREGLQSRRSRKIQSRLKHLDKDSEALSKLRERIKEQRLRSGDNSLVSSEDSSANHKDVVMATDLGQRALHQDNDVVSSRTYGLHLSDKPDEPVPRKVASAPPPQHYKGFSQVETKIRTPDGKVHYMSQVRNERAQRKREKERLKNRLSGKKSAKLTPSEEKVETKPQKSLSSPKKGATRVTGKVHKKEVITVRSWRVGQQVIAKELGPKRITKTTEAPPPVTHEDTDSSESTPVVKTDAPLPVGVIENKEPEVEEEEFLDSLEPGKAQVLSEEARNVLADLKSESDSEDDKKPVKENTLPKKQLKNTAGTKRRAPKAESERMPSFPVAKVRHYDHDDVRKYMLHKKAERRRHLQAEKESKKRAEEDRRLKLEELYKKQREAGAKQKQRDIRQTGHNETFSKEGARELGKRHPFHEDRETVSEMEYKKVESDSSTLTGDSLDEHTPHASDREDEPPARKHVVPIDASTSEDESLSVDQLINKYSKNLPKVAELSNRNIDGAVVSCVSTATSTVSAPPAQAVSIPTTATSHPLPSDTYQRLRQFQQPASVPALSAPVTRPVTSVISISSLPHTSSTQQYTSISDVHRSKLDRIKAIKETAKSLENKIHVETQRLTGEDLAPSVGQSFPHEGKWAVARHRSPITEEDVSDFTPRHDRLAGSRDQYNVFSDDLPGVRNLDALARHAKGHGDRPEVVPRRLSPVDKEAEERRRYLVNEDLQQYLLDSETDESLLDSTLTDATDAQQPLKIGAGLMSGDYCSTTKTVPSSQVLDSPDLDLARYAGLEGDPHSVINIYLRRQKAERERKAAEEYLARKEESMSAAYEDDFTEQRSQSGKAAVKIDRTPDKPRLPIQSSRSELRHSNEHSIDHRDDHQDQESDGTSMDVDSVTSSAGSTPVRGQSVQSLSPSRRLSPALSRDEHQLVDEPSASTKKSQSRSLRIYRDKPVDREISPRRISDRSGDSTESDLSSLSEDTGAQPRKEASSALSLPGHTREEASLRLSPNALQLHLSTELNRMEHADLSILQLAEIERTRGIAFAQQESVSLAQVLKGRQQQHDRDMQLLQLKARQESLEASRQLDVTRQRAAEAAQQAAATVANVREQNMTALHDSTRHLMEKQTEAARATASAAQQLAQAKEVSAVHTEAMRDAGKMATETATAAATAAVQASMEQMKNYTPWWAQKQASAKSQSHKSESTPAYTDTFSSYSSVSPSKSRSSAPAEKYSDISRSTVKSEASVSTASNISAVQQQVSSQPETVESDKSQSINEEIHTDKDASYSQTFDESVSEDEITDQSFRMVLPSETHRRRAKHQEAVSDHVSFSSDEAHPKDDYHSRWGHVTRRDASLSYLSSLSAKLQLSELSSPFLGDDSFNKFTTDMVKQYVREEEMRAQHQAALLNLREKALKEKTRAEMAWLEQQKKKMRDKGADDSYPQIKKKQRGLMLKLKQETAEIKRLQESNRIAAEKRKLLLLQQDQISQLRQSTLQTQERLKSSGPDKRETVDTEDEVSSKLEDLEDDTLKSPRTKDYKSDSDVATEHSQIPGTSIKSASDTSVLNQLKKFKFDKKFLTLREQKLAERRKQAEQLLEWKKRLDREEEEIYKMEKEAINVWEKGKRLKVTGASGKVKEAERKETKPEKAIVHSENKSREAVNESINTTITDKSVTEQVSSEKSRMHLRSASDSSISEEIIQAKADRGRLRSESESSVPEEIQSAATEKGHGRSGSESSIAEDVVSASQSRSSSIAEDVPSMSQAKKSDSIQTIASYQSSNGEYSADTFESSSAPVKKTTPSSKSEKVSTRSLLSQDASLSPRSVKAPRSPLYPRRRGSESESEDSFSQTHSETASDQSDAEGRIRALAEQLKRRKSEAERLKKEQKKRQKDRLKAKEASLLKQIEAYDNVISQVKADLQYELEHEPIKNGVKPQIKQPRVAESKRLKKPQEPVVVKETPPAATSTPALKQRSESESSKSSVSSYDDNKDGGESYSPFSQPLSPALDDTLRAQTTPSPMRVDSDVQGRPLSSAIESLKSPPASFKKSFASSISDRFSQDIPSRSESIRTATQLSKTSEKPSISERLSARSMMSPRAEGVTQSGSIKPVVKSEVDSIQVELEKSAKKVDSETISERIPSYSDNFDTTNDSIKSVLASPSDKSTPLSKGDVRTRSVDESLKSVVDETKGAVQNEGTSENVLSYSDSFDSADSVKSVAESVKSVADSVKSVAESAKSVQDSVQSPPQTPGGKLSVTNASVDGKVLAESKDVAASPTGDSITEEISEHVPDELDVSQAGESTGRLSLGEEERHISEADEKDEGDVSLKSDTSVKSGHKSSSSRGSVQSKESRKSEKVVEDEDNESVHSELSTKAKSEASEKSIKSAGERRAAYSYSRSISDKSDDSQTLTELSYKSESSHSEKSYSEKSSASSRHSLKLKKDKTLNASAEKQVSSSKSRAKDDLSKHSEKRVLSEKTESIEESIPSEDEVSDHLSYHSDKSVDLLNLTAESQPDEGKKPAPSTEEPEHLKTLNIGDRVIISGVQTGTLKFKGTVTFAPGFWTGISLDVSEGTNDGSREGVRYFECAEKRGLFAPPEKVERFVPETEVAEEQDSVLSDKSGLSAGGVSGEKEDDKKQTDIFKEVDKSPGGENLSLTGKEDRSESVIEEVSIATDSELDRVISSAALAVEEFGIATPDDVMSAAATPRVDNAVQEVSPPAEGLTLEQHVDRITDSLTALVVKDSLDALASITAKKTKEITTAVTPEIKSPVKGDPTKVDDPSRPPKSTFLELLTRSESGQDDSVDNDIPEELSFEAGEVSEIVPFPEQKTAKGDAVASQKATKAEDKVDLATDSVIQALLGSTLGNLISLRKKQRQKLTTTTAITETDGGSPTTPPPESPGSPPHTPFTPDSETDEQESFNDSLPLTDDLFENRIQIEVADSPLPRPVSPVLGEPATPIPSHTFDFSSGDVFTDNFTDQWIDDDFGLGGRVPNRPPPPYPGTPGEQRALGEVTKLDLQRLTEELFYAVPHRREDIVNLSHRTVDHYWNLRRYGEDWDNVQPPEDYFNSPDEKEDAGGAEGGAGGADVEGTSRRVFKRLVFELTGEIIEDIYKDEEEVDPLPWARPKYVQRKYIKGKTPPTTSDILKEIVENHIGHLSVSSTKPRKTQHKSHKVGGRKKKDQVDSILVQELREEEPMWVDYSVDEMAVKLQLSDAIFDSLLVETGNLVNEIMSKRTT